LDSKVQESKPQDLLIALAGFGVNIVRANDRNKAHDKTQNKKHSSDPRFHSCPASR
jgi:hypothetical protein